MCQITSAEDLEVYDAWVKSHPDGNLWQSIERKKYIDALGKEGRIYALKNNEQICASALVMIDATIGGYTTWDIPRGPIGEHCEELMAHIIADAKKSRCFALYLSPIKPLTIGKTSPRHVHCEATRVIDIAKTEEDILAQMKQKGRYNIRVAEKRGVTVQESDDIDTFYNLVTKTGARDGFTHLSKEKYRSFLRDLPGSFLLLAYDKQTEPIAGVLSVVWNNQGIYYYGASNHAYRAKMAPYLLQWESMRKCKAEDCRTYDLLGVAPEDAPSNHPWAGISGFKEKFGGELATYPAEQMIVLRPVLYWLLQMKRKILR